MVTTRQAESSPADAVEIFFALFAVLRHTAVRVRTGSRVGSKDRYDAIAHVMLLVFVRPHGEDLHCRHRGFSLLQQGATAWLRLADCAQNNLRRHILHCFIPLLQYGRT